MNGFVESKTKVVKLEQRDESALKLFLSWMSSRDLMPIYDRLGKNDGREDIDILWLGLRAYVFADDYLINEFAASAFTLTLAAVCRLQDNIPALVFRWVFAHTSHMSVLRTLLDRSSLSTFLKRNSSPSDFAQLQAINGFTSRYINQMHGAMRQASVQRPASLTLWPRAFAGSSSKHTTHC